MKKWIDWNEQCEKHGADWEVLTDAKQEPGRAYAYDGDECRCSEGCTGSVHVDECGDESRAYCVEHEEDAP